MGRARIGSFTSIAGSGRRFPYAWLTPAYRYLGQVVRARERRSRHDRALRTRPGDIGAPAAQHRGDRPPIGDFVLRSSNGEDVRGRPGSQNRALRCIREDVNIALIVIYVTWHAALPQTVGLILDHVRAACYSRVLNLPNMLFLKGARVCFVKSFVGHFFW